MTAPSIRPHAFRVVWASADEPGRTLTTPLTVLGDTLTAADARRIIAAAASSSAVTVVDVVALGPVRALHPDKEETGVDGDWRVAYAPNGEADPYPWHYTWTGEGCAAGGHYGSRETEALAWESVAAERAEHDAEA